MARKNRMQPECDVVSRLLPGIAGNQLSTREAWRVERHLADCADCAGLARQYQSLSAVMRAASGHDTSCSFMAKLHERLDTLEPDRARHRNGEALRGWFGSLLPTAAQARRPLIGLGFAAAITGAAVIVMWPAGAPRPARISQAPLARNTAITASNPFDDPVAAQLEARSAAAGSNSSTE